MYKWKKLKFSKSEKEEMRCGKTHTWWDLYYSRFTQETKERRDFINAYNRLKYHLDLGKNIVLSCYCENLRRCHMYIIKEMLENDGYKVIIN